MDGHSRGTEGRVVTSSTTGDAAAASPSAGTLGDALGKVTRLSADSLPMGPPKLAVLHPTPPPEPPPDRGRLLSAAQVAALVGGVSPAWVRRHVPHKLTLGHSTCRWYEGDVRGWLETRRAAS
jgi:predicted DNA-binding transcriptional regulator AlpA